MRAVVVVEWGECSSVVHKSSSVLTKCPLPPPLSPSALHHSPRPSVRAPPVPQRTPHGARVVAVIACVAPPSQCCLQSRSHARRSGTKRRSAETADGLRCVQLHRCYCAKGGGRGAEHDSAGELLRCGEQRLPWPPDSCRRCTRTHTKTDTDSRAHARALAGQAALQRAPRAERPRTRTRLREQKAPTKRPRRGGGRQPWPGGRLVEPLWPLSHELSRCAARHPRPPPPPLHLVPPSRLRQCACWRAVVCPTALPTHPHMFATAALRPPPPHSANSLIHHTPIHGTTAAHTPHPIDSLSARRPHHPTHTHDPALHGPLHRAAHCPRHPPLPLYAPPHPPTPARKPLRQPPGRRL